MVWYPSRHGQRHFKAEPWVSQVVTSTLNNIWTEWTFVLRSALAVGCAELAGFDGDNNCRTHQPLTKANLCIHIYRSASPLLTRGPRIKEQSYGNKNISLAETKYRAVTLRTVPLCAALCPVAHSLVTESCLVTHRGSKAVTLFPQTQEGRSRVPMSQDINIS